MNRLVWKLLRQHISVGQLAGFFLANLFGMMIVLLSVQFSIVMSFPFLRKGTVS